MAVMEVSWPERLWMMVHEPRVITATTGLLWVVLTGVGVAALVAPPPSISHEAGPLLVTIWASLLTLGGVLGAAGCLPGWWWVERSGIIATWTGGAVWLYVVAGIDYPPGTESSALSVSGLIVAVMVTLVIRWQRISSAQVDPTRYPRRRR